MQLKALFQLFHSDQTWHNGIVVQVTAAAIWDIARRTVVVTTLQAKTVTAIVLELALFLERLQAALIQIGISLSLRVTMGRGGARLSVVKRSGSGRDKVVVSVGAALTRRNGAKRGGNVTTARRHRLGVRWLHNVVDGKECALHQDLLEKKSRDKRRNDSQKVTRHDRDSPSLNRPGNHSCSPVLNVVRVSEVYQSIKVPVRVVAESTFP